GSLRSCRSLVRIQSGAPLPLGSMSHQVLFIQGAGSGTHDDWDNHLVEQLGRELGSGYEIRYPRMPNEADPHYARWKAAIKHELAGLSDGAILVGHSVGATILVNTLADETLELTLSGIFLLSAPFIGDGGWPAEDIKPMSSLGKRLPESLPVYIYHGS